MKKVLVLVVILIIGAFGYLRMQYDFYRVPSGSMAPLIVSGDMVAVNKKAFLNKEPMRHDLVIFRNQGASEKLWIREIVGLPEESILNYETGWFSIKDIKFYLSPSEPQPRWLDKKGPVIKIPENTFFVLGSERSYDSRHIGPIARTEIIGKVVFTAWPIAHWKLYKQQAG